MSTARTGRFIWYECLTKDPEQAIAFYKDVVGWGTTVWEGGEDPYHMLTKGEGVPVAGVMQLPEEAQAQGAPSHWLAYIGVEDVEATIAKAEELGGTKLFGPLTIPGVGVMAVLQDPQSAFFAVYAPESDPEHIGDRPELGDGSWHELMTPDPEAGFDFYSTLVGWEKTTAMDMGENGTYQMYGVPGCELGGMMILPAEMGAPPCWTVYFMVPDADAAAKRIEAGGGRIMIGPMDVPGGDRIAYGSDPTGAIFAVHSKGS
jgi:predicted enzyme related to lactoylglutathione lyase